MHLEGSWQLHRLDYDLPAETQVFLHVKSNSIYLYFDAVVLKLKRLTPTSYCTGWWKDDTWIRNDLTDFGQVVPNTLWLIHEGIVCTVWLGDGLTKSLRIGSITNMIEADESLFPDFEPNLIKLKLNTNEKYSDAWYVKVIRAGLKNDPAPMLPQPGDILTQDDILGHQVYTAGSYDQVVNAVLKLSGYLSLHDIQPKPNKLPYHLDVNILSNSLNLLLPRMYRYLTVDPDSPTRFWLDLSYQRELETRASFDRYGVKVCLDENLSAIKILLATNDGNWVQFPLQDAYALRVAIASISLHLVIYNHLCQLHLGSLHRLIGLALQQSNPKIKHLLRLFTTNGAELTMKVKKLFMPAGGLLKRLFGLTEPAYTQMLQASIGTNLWPVQSYAEIIQHLSALNDVIKHPVAKVYLDFHRRMHAFLTCVDTDLADMATVDIVSVTLCHSIEGMDVAPNPVKIWRAGGGGYGLYTSESDEAYKQLGDDLTIYESFTLANDYTNYFSAYTDLNLYFKQYLQSAEMSSLLQGINLKLESVTISTDM